MALGHLGVDWEGLQRFLNQVNASFPLQKAILFGSRVRGDELMDSDYDLVLVSKAFQPLAWTDRIRAILDLWDLEVNLEVFCYTPEEFEHKAAEIGTVSEAVRCGKNLL